LSDVEQLEAYSLQLGPEQADPTAQQQRNDVNYELVDEAGRNGLLGSVRAEDDDVPPSGRLTCGRERLVDSGAEKRDRGQAALPVARV
jgi:hypothetical protein